MKRISMIVLILSGTLGVFAQDQPVVASSRAKGPRAAAFLWSATTYDFGKIKAGVPVAYQFGFSNTGMVPLIITSVKASCGCTVTAYTKDPVEKGATGFVSAKYDAAKPGKFSKTVAVYANTVEGMVQLTITGEVVE